MPKVKLNDVAVECKETIKGEASLPVVGLEHLIPGEVCLTQWSDDSDNTFTKRFRKGQVLFSRRRAYLKKAAVAPFDGICSGDITVIAARPEVLEPELLPFIIQNDALFDYAVGHSAGSLSPRVKWEHLKNYEFELPDKSKQSRLARLLWAVEDARKAYQTLIQRSEELVKSQFIEMFRRENSGKQDWPTLKSGEVYNVKSSKRIYAKELVPAGIPFLKVADILDRIATGTSTPTAYISQEKYRELKEMGLVPETGDILVTSRGTIGKCYIITSKDEFYFQDGMISWLHPKPGCQLLPEFIAALFEEEEFLKALDEATNKTTVTYISLDKLGGLSVICPPERMQHGYLDFVHQLDKSKHSAQKALEDLQATQKALIRKYLG